MKNTPGVSLAAGGSAPLERFLLANIISYNISFLGSPEQAESRVSKKGYRSSNYNNYMVEVVDFDNESHTFEVDARSESEASELAADMAMSAGVQVSYCNVYLYVDSF